MLNNSTYSLVDNKAKEAAKFRACEAVKSHAYIQVWVVPFHLLRVQSSQFDCLATKEQERASKLVTIKGTRHFILARSFLRKLLASQMNCAASAVDIQYTPSGKPYVSNGPAFNLSHCDRLLCVAIANNSFTGQLGIDVEPHISDPAVLRLTSRCFSQSERDQLATFRSKSASYRAFTRGWTRKEAVVKAIGTGLQSPLNEFNVCLNECVSKEQYRFNAKHSLLFSSDLDGVSPDNCELYDLGSRFNCEVSIAIVHSGRATGCKLRVHDVDLRQLNAIAGRIYG